MPFSRSHLNVSPTHALQAQAEASVSVAARKDAKYGKI